MTETESCIWLQSALGPGSPLPMQILAEYGSVNAFYEAGGTEWRLSGLFTTAQLDKLEQASPCDAERIRMSCDRAGYSVIGISDPNYPKCLFDLRAAPAVLYVHGKLPDFNRTIAIGMVGTREATPYGVQVAAQLATELVRRNVCIVSGGALGIDTASHRGALMGGGCTVAVLGCGFNVRYLMTNASLRAQIARTGALVSEYPPDTPVQIGSFPMRNRIIAALSLGTVVVEAGERSGALITAKQALELGRDVFAVPGSILNKATAGINRLLRDGAKPVANANDILEEYETVYGDRIRPGNTTRGKEKTDATAVSPVETTSAKSVKKAHAPQITSAQVMQAAEKCACTQMPDGLSEAAQKLYNALTVQPQPIDQLSQMADLSAREALAAVTELEMFGAVKGFPGKQYALK